MTLYPKNTASSAALWWLEQDAERREIHIHIHIHHAHSGERWVEHAPVDGYDPVTRIYFNTTAATGMAVLGVTQKTVIESSPTTKHVAPSPSPKHVNNVIKQLWNAQECSDLLATLLSRDGSVKSDFAKHRSRELKHGATLMLSSMNSKRTLTRDSVRKQRLHSHSRTHTYLSR